MRGDVDADDEEDAYNLHTEKNRFLGECFQSLQTVLEMSIRRDEAREAMATRDNENYIIKRRHEK